MAHARARACWITRAADTLSIILMALPWQQWLLKCMSFLLTMCVLLVLYLSQDESSVQPESPQLASLPLSMIHGPKCS